MITSTKNYTKKKKNKERQNPSTNGKSKAVQTKSHKEAYTCMLTKREKAKKKYIFCQSEVFCQRSVGVLYEFSTCRCIPDVFVGGR